MERLEPTDAARHQGPPRPVPARPGWRLAGAAALIGAAIVALWVHWSPLQANDVTPSEGYYGIQARNLLLDPRHRLSPSLRPMGEPGFKPPLYPALLALSVRAQGANEAALRWPSLLCAAWIAIALASLVARGAGAAAGLAAAALFLSLPWVADSSRFAESVVPLTALGAGALVVLAARPPGLLRGLAAGALLGLGFQCKMWLVLPLLLPALAMAWPRRPALAGLLVALAAVGAAHLAAVAALEPAQLAGWVDFTWRQFLWKRLAGAEYYGALEQPPGFYWGILAHAFVLVLPLVGLGALEAIRRWREPVPRALLVWALGAAGLSAMAVKLAIYLYAVVPAWAALAALGASALARGSPRPGRPTLAALGLLLVAGSPPVVAAAGGPAPSGMVWLTSWGAFAAAGLVTMRRPARRTPVAVALLGIAILGGLARDAQRLPLRYHDPGCRVVARAIASRVEDVPPGHTAILAPDAPAFGYYLFRTARYWFLDEGDTPERRLARVAADSLARVFIVDRGSNLYGGTPDPGMLAWLGSATREITDEIETRAGRRIAVRVFVREPARPAAPAAPRAGR